MAATLYPGIPFSPQAALTNNIGAADTIIEVSDASAFPPAPNLATIGTDEDGETVLYTAKTETALSGCQRGIEGAARAWTAGELIGRNFTAKDHTDLIAAVSEAGAAATAAGAAARAAQEAASTAEGKAAEAAETAGEAARDATQAREDAQTAADAAATAQGAAETAQAAASAAQEAAERALPITGGTMEGDVTVPWGKKIIFGAEGPDYGRLEFYADLSGDAHFQYADDPDITERESTRIGGIAAPKYNDEAANKKYVDGRAAAGRRGVNLLDNWYFPDPINQRGQTEYATSSSNIYGIDRWMLSLVSLKLIDDGITLQVSTQYDWPSIRQRIEAYEHLAGKHLSISALVRNPHGLKVLVTLKPTDGSGSGFITASTTIQSDEWQLIHAHGVFPESIAAATVMIYADHPTLGTSFDVMAVKLELGDHQTLAHQDASGSWVLNDPPPDRTLELLKCRRYQQVFDWGEENFVIGYGNTTSTTTANAFLSAVPKMRAAPAISNTDGGNWSCTANGEHVKITSISPWFSSHYGIGIRVFGNFPSGAGQIIIINSNSANKVIFDANL